MFVFYVAKLAKCLYTMYIILHFVNESTRKAQF